MGIGHGSSFILMATEAEFVAVSGKKPWIVRGVGVMTGDAISPFERRVNDVPIPLQTLLVMALIAERTPLQGNGKGFG